MQNSQFQKLPSELLPLKYLLTRQIMILKNKIVLLVICNCLMLSPLSYSQNWSYELEPYVLFSNIEGDAGVGRVSGAPVDVDFSDILEVLELGAMGHFEAHHESGWGLSLDYGFMDLAADISTARGGVVDASVRQGVLEALGMYRSSISVASSMPFSACAGGIMISISASIRQSYPAL